MTMPGFIMGFREGLEAFLLIAITLKYITSINQGHLKNKVIQGSVAGLIISVILGLLLSQSSGSEYFFKRFVLDFTYHYCA